MTGERGLDDHAVLDAQRECELVTAARVDAVVRVRGGIHLVLVVGMCVVLHEGGGAVEVTHARVLSCTENLNLGTVPKLRVACD